MNVRVLAALTLCLIAAHSFSADDAPGIVSHVKVISDKVPDVSSLENWKRSFIKDGMSDAEKAMAIWKTVVMFGLEGAPIAEHMSSAEGCVHDAIKTFNVYGCNFCDCSGAMVESLARYVNLEARGWNLNGHCVSEIYYDNAWHLLDAAYVNYFPKPDGQIAGVEELKAAAKEWYDKNPGYLGDGGKLYQFMKNGGWKNGPALIAACPTFDTNGATPCALCNGWQATMGNYDGTHGTPGLYDHGYIQGYGVNIQLRKGERIIRNWANQGKTLPLAHGMPPGFLDLKVGEGALAYSAKIGDLGNGRIGHGRHEYNLPLANGAFRGGALLAENLASKSEDNASPALHAKDAEKPAVLIFRMTSGYLFLTGAASLNAVVGEGGEIAVAISMNNGLDWSDVAKVTASGEQNIDLNKFVSLRYDYRLKVTLKGKGTGLESLKVGHDILHSQRPLPALGQGENSISFSAEPAEGTLTISGAPDPDVKQQLRADDFHPVMNNVSPKSWILSAGTGDITFPVSTPGELTRLRFGCNYRARDAKDGWDYQLSFDGGKTFKTVAHAGGPCAGNSKYITYSEIPAGTKDALVRFAGTQRNVSCVFRFSIDADYKEPNGGFAPVKITYAWEENGQAKSDVHTARSAQEKYSINCASKPLMKSITLELAE
jgi:hypothetical protein